MTDALAAALARAEAAEAECARLRADLRDAADARGEAAIARHVAERERDALRAYMASIGAEDAPCTCGSGGHPRACKRHPWAMAAHIMELNYENARVVADVLEGVEAERDALRVEADRTSAYFAKTALEYERKYGHGDDCHTVQRPGDDHMGCNCIVADIERGCMGDVTYALRRVMAERDALRAIVAGRAVAPTDAEIDAHCAAGGRWTISHDHDGRRLTYTLDADVFDVRAEARYGGPNTRRWWPLDATGAPCAWPVPP